MFRPLKLPLQYDLNRLFLHSTCRCHCTVDRQSIPDSGFYPMGRSAGTAAEASFGSKLALEKVSFHKHVPHGPLFICSYANNGALLQSLVSLPVRLVDRTRLAKTSCSWQEVQLLSPTQASIRFLPSMPLGAILNLVTGLIVHKFPVIYIVLISSALGAFAPLLMAITSPRWPYWYSAFPAQLFEPLDPDGESSQNFASERRTSFANGKFSLVIFTVGILLVSEVFPDRIQTLAGAVFNTVGQFGQAIGLALMGVVSGSVTHNSKYTNKIIPGALLVGYRAGFWTSTGFMALTRVIGALGLRKSGRVGLKRD